MSKIDKNGNIEISPTSKHLKQGAKDGTFRESSISSKYSSKGATTSLFAFIVLILFTIAFSHYIRTGTFIDFSFKSLIDYFAGMPDVSISFATFNLEIYADLGVFNFVKSLWNPIACIMEFGITLSGMGIQMFVVLGYLVGLFFL